MAPMLSYVCSLFSTRCHIQVGISRTRIFHELFHFAAYGGGEVFRKKRVSFFPPLPPWIRHVD